MSTAIAELVKNFVSPPTSNEPDWRDAIGEQKRIEAEASLKLKQLGGKAIPYLFDEFDREKVRDLVYSLGSVAIIPLCAELLNRQERPEALQHGLTVLRVLTKEHELDEEHVKHIRALCLPLLQNAHEAQIYTDAALILGKTEKGKGVSENSPVFSPLMQLFETGTPKQQRAAVSILGHLGDPRAAEPLRTRLSEVATEFPSDDVALDYRKGLIFALGFLKDVQAVDVLIQLVHCSHLELHDAAAIALGLIGNPQAVEPLLQLLTETVDDLESWEGGELSTMEVQLCQSLITALGRLKDGRAVDPLISLLDGKHPVLFKKIKWYLPFALNEIGDFRAIDPLITFIQKQKYGFDSLSRALENFPVPAIRNQSHIFAFE
jgi:HEAT repeat protein